MGVGVKVNVWGDYALFTRPELKTERYSYDIITPSAARGILEAIYWHPGMRWIIDKIYVKNPIQFTSVRRNEVTSKISKSKMQMRIMAWVSHCIYAPRMRLCSAHPFCYAMFRMLLRHISKSRQKQRILIIPENSRTLS